jgi:hypothetical protein
MELFRQLFTIPHVCGIRYMWSIFPEVVNMAFVGDTQTPPHVGQIPQTNSGYNGSIIGINNQVDSLYNNTDQISGQSIQNSYNDYTPIGQGLFTSPVAENSGNLQTDLEATMGLYLGTMGLLLLGQENGTEEHSLGLNIPAGMNELESYRDGEFIHPETSGILPEQAANTQESDVLTNLTNNNSAGMTPEMQAITESNGLGKYDQIVESVYGEGSFVVDTAGEQEGQLDPNDVIKYVDPETGQWAVSLVGDEYFDMQFRGATIDACNQFNDGMNSGRLSFEGDMTKQQYNEEFWEPVTIEGREFWRVKEGINPSDAINDVFENGSYTLDCAASTNMVALKAEMDTIGVDNFNSDYNGLTMSGWTVGTDKHGTGQLEFDLNGPLDYYSGDAHNNDGNAEDLRPGDFVYFRNLDVEYGSAANQGENAFYMGNNENGEPVFFGNPIGMATGESNEYGGLSTYVSSADPDRLASAAG